METTKLNEFKGIGVQYVALLENAGIHTTDELATMDPKALHQQLLTINTQKRLVRQMPSIIQVSSWVARVQEG